MIRLKHYLKSTTLYLINGTVTMIMDVIDSVVGLMIPNWIFNR